MTDFGHPQFPGTPFKGQVPTHGAPDPFNAAIDRLIKALGALDPTSGHKAMAGGSERVNRGRGFLDGQTSVSLAKIEQDDSRAEMLSVAVGVELVPNQAATRNIIGELRVTYGVYAKPTEVTLDIINGVGFCVPASSLRIEAAVPEAGTFPEPADLIISAYVGRGIRNPGTTPPTRTLYSRAVAAGAGIDFVLPVKAVSAYPMSSDGATTITMQYRDNGANVLASFTAEKNASPMYYPIIQQAQVIRLINNGLVPIDLAVCFGLCL